MNPILFQYIIQYIPVIKARFFSFILDLVRSNFHSYQRSGVVYVWDWQVPIPMGFDPSSQVFISQDIYTGWGPQDS